MSSSWMFPDEWWKMSARDYDYARLSLKALEERDLDIGIKNEARYFNRAIPCLHEAMRALYNLIGEEDAAEAVEAAKLVNRTGKTTKRTPNPREKKLKRIKYDQDTEVDHDDEEIVVSRGLLKKIFASIVAADAATRERLFIVQVAAEEGWDLANRVAVRKFRRAELSDVDPDYKRVMELREKRGLTEWKKPSSSEGPAFPTNKCFRCGGLGHWARDCYAT